MNYKEALQAYIDATNSHDFNNVKDLLHPNAVYWFTDRSCTSLEEIECYFNNAWDTIKNEVYSAKDVQWISESDTSAACIYTYHYEGYYEGKFVSGSGRATNVFTFVGHKWELIHEHLSSPVE
ncbi:YybH family protein [Lederbergia citri]|uniref:Nuclear transport factor 2 family protein n=1 Tax=Lederbergia citri TaxID=2833580 RepID=A0A942THK5_9BACI|nr:nuclear transport factor 2 family protein [Lederbergia citri]MBS4196737.1 nuclear transport factor 2 family protein [Lederbergia citri]